jgi:hypothetical protein
MRRSGWFGDSHGHSLAAKGFRSRKQDVKLVDPVFYVRKREEQVPFADVMDAMRERQGFVLLRSRYPDADEEDVRRQAIKALDTRDGTDVMQTMDKNGVDDSVRLARMSPALRQSMMRALNDSQKCSYMHQVKVDALKKRLGDLDVA